MHIFGPRRAFSAASPSLSENKCFPLSPPRPHPNRRKPATLCFCEETQVTAFSLCLLMRIRRAFHYLRPRYCLVRNTGLNGVCRSPCNLSLSARISAQFSRKLALPRHVETMMDSFHGQLTLEQQADPRFAYCVAFVQKVTSKASSADQAIEFVKPGSEEASETNRILLKEVERLPVRL